MYNIADKYKHQSDRNICIIWRIKTYLQVYIIHLIRLNCNLVFYKKQDCVFIDSKHRLTYT